MNAADFAELSESEKRHFSYHEDHVHRPDIQYGGSQSISEEEFSKVERPHRQIGLARRAIEKLKQELLKWKLSGRLLRFRISCKSLIWARYTSGEVIRDNKIEMSAMVTMDSIVVAGNDQVTTDLDGETIGLQMANGIYFNLNPVGTSVWKLIQEPRKVRRIYEELIKEYTVQPEVCARDLLALLQQLAEAQLVVVES